MSLTIPQPTEVIRFGVFEADLRSGELRKNGIRVKIQDLPFRALKLLVSRPNEVLTRDQFRRALWPEGVFVDFDHGISSAINRLRDALGDAADNPVFIETVERRGYRWIAPTHVPAFLPLGPVLVHTAAKDPEPTQIKEDSALVPPPHRWGWVLVIPACVLLLAIWGFRPIHRSAAAVPRATGFSTPGATHHPPDAEEFYLKGRFYWEKRTPDGLNKAVDYFTQAIVSDPNYAPAYVGLADCYNLLREYTLMPATEAYPRALAAAKKAVELDPQSSEAHASLAFALFYGNWDARAADAEFRRAIELNPRNAAAHHWYATYLSAIGRSAESLAEINAAQALEPASKAILADKGDLLWLAGQPDSGITLLRQLESTEPDFISPHRYLKVADLIGGDYPGYLSEGKKEAALMHDNSAERVVEMAEKGYQSGGGKGLLQAMLSSQKKLYEDGKLSPYFVAETLSLLGEKQSAMQYLKAAFEQHDEHVIGMKSDRAFANIANDQGFRELMTQLGFPPRT